MRRFFLICCRTWNIKFDFIHIRQLLGAMSRADWKDLYKKAYENLQPGGWIEQVEGDIGFCSDDGSLPADSLLSSQWRTMYLPMAERAGRPMDMADTMRASIEEAGFINVHQQEYKAPLGDWPRLQVYKDAGRVNKKQILSGLEGWLMYFLTQHGDPTPWSPEEVQVLVAKFRKELDAGWHIYQKAKRVWAQKPFDKEQKVTQPRTIEDVASASPSPTRPRDKKPRSEHEE